MTEERGRAAVVSSAETWGGMIAALIVASPVVVGVVYALLGALGMIGAGAGLEARSGFVHIQNVVSDAAVMRSTLWTLWIAGASTLLAGVGGAAVALLYRGDGRTDRIGRGLAVLPLAVPHLAAGVSGLLILGQSGLLARVGYQLGWIEVPRDMPVLVLDPLGVGLILSMTWKELPFLGLVAASVLATRGAALEETARGLGARPADVLLRVTWPQLWRGMLPAALAVFTFVFGSYEVAALLGPSDPMALPVLTWERYTDVALSRRGEAYVLSLIGILLAAGSVGAHEWLTARGRSRGLT